MKETLIAAVKILRESKTVEDFALIGKLALIPQVASITSTLDIDFLAIIKNTEEFQKELKTLGFKTGKIKLPNKATLIRFWNKKKRIPVDVFEAKEAWQKKIVKDAFQIRFFNTEIPIARKEGILVLKIAFYRDFKDRDAVRILLEDQTLDRIYFERLLNQAGLTDQFQTIARKIWHTPKKNPKNPLSFGPDL